MVISDERARTRKSKCGVSEASAYVLVREGREEGRLVVGGGGWMRMWCEHPSPQ